MTTDSNQSTHQTTVPIVDTIDYYYYCECATLDEYIKKVLDGRLKISKDKNKIFNKVSIMEFTMNINEKYNSYITAYDVIDWLFSKFSMDDVLKLVHYRILLDYRKYRKVKFVDGKVLPL